MAGTVYDASEPCLTPRPTLLTWRTPTDSSEEPQDDSSEDPPEHHSGTTPMAPLDDMEIELPEEDPDPITENVNMPDSSSLPLLSVGDQHQTLGPPHTPKEPTNLGPAWWVDGHKPQQLVPQDPPLLAPAFTLASATDTNHSTNVAPVSSTITTLWQDHSPTPFHKHNTSHQNPSVSTHSVIH